MAELVETLSCCTAVETMPLLSNPKLTDVGVVVIPELVVMLPQLPEIAFMLVPEAMPVIVKVSVGSMVPST